MMSEHITVYDDDGNECDLGYKFFLAPTERERLEAVLQWANRRKKPKVWKLYGSGPRIETYLTYHNLMVMIESLEDIMDSE
jgi:hypothetical protein